MGREADNSLTYSDEAKNGGAITPLSRTSLWRGAYLSTGTIFFTLVESRVLRRIFGHN
jgi:hypothetical protein